MIFITKCSSRYYRYSHRESIGISWVKGGEGGGGGGDGGFCKTQTFKQMCEVYSEL